MSPIAIGLLGLAMLAVGIVTNSSDASTAAMFVLTWARLEMIERKLTK